MYGNLISDLGLASVFHIIDLKKVDLPFIEWYGIACEVSKSARGMSTYMERLSENLWATAQSFEDWHCLYHLGPLTHKPATTIKVNEKIEWRISSEEIERLAILRKMAGMACSMQECMIVASIGVRDVVGKSTQQIEYVDTGKTRTGTRTATSPVTKKRISIPYTLPDPDEIYHVHPYVGEIEALQDTVLQKAMRRAVTPADWYFIANRSSRLYEKALQKLAVCACSVSDWKFYYFLTKDGSFHKKNPGPQLALEKIAALMS